MVHYIFSVIGVVLLGVMATVSTLYIDFSTIWRAEDKAQITTGFHQWSLAYRAFLRDTSLRPSPSNYRLELAGYLNEPTPIKGWGWSYGQSTRGGYFCLSGPNDRTDDAFSRAIKGYQTSVNITLSDLPNSAVILDQVTPLSHYNKVFIAPECGAIKDQPLTPNGQGAVTQWIS